MKPNPKAFRYLIIGYVVACAFLFLYSYTQVDLGLTLSRMSVWQVIQKSFQDIGYFRRPLSTGLYLVGLSALTGLYVVLLRLTGRGQVSRQQLWRLVLAVTAILVLSYPAFSYDLFNYIFTAKTVLIYHKNPYTVIPLDFQGVDPMLNYMHWTQLPSAYTPLWIGMTLPAYLLGFGLFLPIMWNIKLLVAGFYLLTVWYLGKILDKLEPGKAILGMAIFGLNPLVLIEALVSGHNDVVMMALAMVAFWLWLQKRQLASGFTLALSVAAKLMTVFVFPVALLGWRRGWALAAMLIGFGLVLFQREVLPWYWLWIMPFVALLPSRREITIVACAVSVGLLLRYAPFLYFGNWNSPVPTIELWLTLTPIALTLAALGWYRAAGRTRPR